MAYRRRAGRQPAGHPARAVDGRRSAVEDERRLFYVATTRATANLVFSYVRHAVRSKVEPSQFLAEIGLGKGEEKRATFIA